MKFFSKYIMTREHIRALRESRKVYVKHKVVDYALNFVEHYDFAGGVWVYPENDSLLEEIEKIKIYDKPVYDERIGRYVNYDYYSLSYQLRAYMQKKDAEFFDKWYKKHKFKDAVPVHEYDRCLKRLEEEKGELTNDDLEAVLIGKVETQKASTYKKARFSARRAYANLLGLIRANLDKFESFVTLTFARRENEEKYKEFGANFRYINPQDFEEAKKAFLGVVKVLAKNMRRKGLEFEYVATWEMHKDGSFHFHMICSALPDELLCDTPSWLDIDYRTGKERKGKMLVHWEYGKSDYEEIRDKEKISTYVSKYIMKSLRNIDEEHYETFLNAKKYFSSRGLRKPNVKYISDDDVMLEEKEKVTGYSDVYPVVYHNAYDGSRIEKKVYSKRTS